MLSRDVARLEDAEEKGKLVTPEGEVLLSLADLLKRKEILETANIWIDALSAKVPREHFLWSAAALVPVCFACIRWDHLLRSVRTYFAAGDVEPTRTTTGLLVPALGLRADEKDQTLV